MRGNWVGSCVFYSVFLQQSILCCGNVQLWMPFFSGITIWCNQKDYFAFSCCAHYILVNFLQLSRCSVSSTFVSSQVWTRQGERITLEGLNDFSLCRIKEYLLNFLKQTCHFLVGGGVETLHCWTSTISEGDSGNLNALQTKYYWHRHLTNNRLLWETIRKPITQMISMECVSTHI